MSAEYSALRRRVVDGLGSLPDRDSALERLKLRFESTIDSKRRYELITSPEELIRTLERRGRVSPRNARLFDELGAEFGIPTNRPDDRKQRINRLVVAKIGAKFRELSRRLGISDDELETIEIRYDTDPASKLTKILSTFESSVSSDREYCERMCDALRDCRRGDLRNEVRRIWDDSI